MWVSQRSLIMPAGPKEISQINMGVSNGRMRLVLSNWISLLFKCLLKHNVAVGEGALSPLSPGLDMYCGNGHTRKTTGTCAVTSCAKGFFTTHQPSKNEQQEIWEPVLFYSCNSFPFSKAEHARNWAISSTLNTCLAQAQPSQSEAGPSANWGLAHRCPALILAENNLAS